MWRLIITSILFLLSLLVLFKAPTNFLWRVSVAVTEFPYLFIATSFLFFVSCFWAVQYKLPLIAINAITVLLFSFPVLQAMKLASTLPGEMATQFPTKNQTGFLKQPFLLMSMFKGIGIKKQEPVILPYKTVQGHSYMLDFYASSIAGKRPCVIVIHGGSWREGDSKQLPDLNSYLANRGYHVAAINYRLAPQYQSPAPVEDTQEALRYLTKEAENLNIDTTNFILAGRSAGGQIALVAAYSLHHPNIKGVISFYGPADMAWGATVKTNKLVLDVDNVFSDYLGGLIAQVPAKYKESTSLEYVTPSSPPTLLIHGPNDALVSYEHSVHLAQKLKENHVRHYFLSLPWATHGCDYNIQGPSGQLSTYAVEHFINSVVTQSWKN